MSLPCLDQAQMEVLARILVGIQQKFGPNLGEHSSFSGMSTY